MFGIKAYFKNDRVYIRNRELRSNETLTACLRLPSEKLEKLLSELKRCRAIVQLQFGGDDDFCSAYDDHVQAAQNLLYRVGNVANTIPVYADMPSLNNAHLWDVLNQFRYWEDNIDEDVFTSQEYFHGDYSDEYGYSEYDSDNDSAHFYYQHFAVSPDTLDDDDAEVVLSIKNLNRDIRNLFDHYITFITDTLRVQRTYAPLLDRIHSRDKFLTDSEQAEAITDYLSKSKKADRPVSGSMRMSYEVMKGTLCEAYEFDTLGAFLYVDFFRGLSRNCIPRRCRSCGSWFLIPGGKYTQYCDAPLADDPTKTCRDVGARKKYDDKCRTDPIWLAYNRAYKAHYARYMKKKMTTAQFEQWSRYAVELRDKAENDEIEPADYLREIRV